MNAYDIFLESRIAFRIEPVLRDAVRIRCNASGIFKQTLLERYGLVQIPETGTAVRGAFSNGTYTVTSGELTVEIREDASFSVRRQNGETVLERVIPFSPREDNGVGGKISISDGERFYGGGYRPNKNLELRGQIIRNWCAPVTNNGPSTWILSSSGWGLFWLNTAETYFDFGCRREDELVFWSERGEFDIMLFTGSLKKMITDYTDVTGKPSLMPEFGYGITVVNNEAENEVTLMDKAERLRREGIPTDTFSISCDWMSTYYDKSVKQSWNTDKYFIKPWMRGEQTFLSVLKRFGIKTTLWTPCMYDLTFEQERRYYAKHPDEVKTPLYDRSVRKNDNSELSIDANSRLFRDEKLYPTVRFDNITVPEQAWAEHFKKYFDLGVIGIAEDGHAVEITKSDLLYSNGYSYREMHNLNQSLNSLQYFEIYREHTGKRIFVRTPSTFIGHQRYCGTWCGDTTSDTSLIGLMQYSFQGQSNISADLICENKEQIHAGMLMPWVLSFCWAHMAWPWMLTDELRETYIEYAKLRYSLMPYIYTAARRAHETGIPMCSAMVIHYPDDERFFDSYTQYMLGESLLVGALSNTVSLPQGQWIDYWTGRTYDGGCTVTDGYPKDKGGYLFIKKGAILPYWENITYVGERPIDSMVIRIYPDGRSEYVLYEDDGETFAYEQGEYAQTKIRCIADGDSVKVTIDAPTGQYSGMPPARVYHVELYMEQPRTLPPAAVYDTAKKAVCFDIHNGGSAEFVL